MILDYVNQFSTTLQRELLRQLGHGVVPNDAKGRSAAPGEGFPPLHKRWPTCNPNLVLSKYVRFRVWNGGTWECVQVRLENCVARPEVISRCKQPDESEVGELYWVTPKPYSKTVKCGVDLLGESEGALKRPLLGPGQLHLAHHCFQAGTGAVMPASASPGPFFRQHVSLPSVI